MNDKKRLGVLVVDDSAFNRRNIAEIFAGSDDAEVVGKAADGDEALRLAAQLKPDVITLDLEMPRMDGFTFLRILMAKQPTPVIVVSSYSQKENVFKALELGAIDFVAKPERQVAPEGADVRTELLEKVRLVRNLRRAGPEVRSVRPREATPPSEQPTGTPKLVIGVASSTGGPTALLEVFSKLSPRLPAAVLVAQHMPDKFTRTFAERLDKRGSFRVAEGQEGDLVAAQRGYVCPGRQCMEIVRVGAELRLRTGAPGTNDRYVPSADRLLSSVAALASPALAVCGVVLTGMGDDGLVGARAIRDAGGVVVAESEESAVVYGMPGAVVRAGLAHEVLPLSKIADFLATLQGP